jgi:hypothetical protein
LGQSRTAYRCRHHHGESVRTHRSHLSKCGPMVLHRTGTRINVISKACPTGTDRTTLASGAEYRAACDGGSIAKWGRLPAATPGS